MEQQKIIITCLFLIYHSFTFSQENFLHRASMAEDLTFLKQELEAQHPNLYTYSAPEEINSWFKNQKRMLPDSLTEQDAYRLISSFSNLIKDGHSYIYKSAEHLNRFFSSAPLFPLDVMLRGEELIVTADYSAEQNIPLGASLISINGNSIQELQNTILANLSRDGDNMSYPRHLFYQFFAAYYSQFYGFQEDFSIVYKGDNNRESSSLIKGRTRNEIKSRRLKSQKPEDTKGIYLKIFNKQKLAVLTIKTFDNKILKEDYHQKFKRAINEAFQQLSEKEVSHLAIDLRDIKAGVVPDIRIDDDPSRFMEGADPYLNKLEEILR